jgi:hypothetical protein
MGGVSSPEAVLDRLPRTMAASMNEQLARREFLFPVERRLLAGRLEWLAGLEPAQFDRLFAALKGIEARMPLSPKAKDNEAFSIENTAVIARSPLYPEWRREAERVFATIDDGAEKLSPASPIPRLLFCVLPAGLPAASDPWNDAPPGGIRVSLEAEFGAIQSDLLAAIARRKPPRELESVEWTWIVACEARPYTELSPATVVTWEETAKLRRTFLDHLNDVHRTLRSVDQTMSTLERIDLSAFLPSRLTSDMRLREFVRSLLLSGNGSLVINNSFVQWCASEALRRAQPQALLAAFGIRDKPKPFSSLAWFEDQSRANPTPDQPDLAGSLIDDQMLSQYVSLTTRRLKPYAGRTLALFAAVDRNSALVFPPDPGKTTGEWTRPKLPLPAVSEACLRWLETTVPTGKVHDSSGK